MEVKNKAINVENQLVVVRGYIYVHIHTHIIIHINIHTHTHPFVFRDPTAHDSNKVRLQVSTRF